MRDGLVAVELDKEVLRTVQSKAVQSIFKKFHVQSTIPIAIRHGPAEFGGLDIYDLRTEAGLEAIKQVLSQFGVLRFGKRQTNSNEPPLLSN
jgi:hypothetical protein